MKDSSGGFSNQQALLVLLICFPVGLIGLGLVVILLQRPAPQIAQPQQPPGQPLEPQTPAQPLPSPSPAPLPSGLNELQARAIVEEWLSIKPQIFASPFNTELADQVVAAGPLWTDLTKTDGSIEWLKKNNSYYSYASIKVNEVIRFLPSPSMPSIVVSVSEDSVLHSPRGNKASSTTSNWLYTLKEEGGRWKIWDYRKQ
jgi:hypothetical protein